MKHVITGILLAAFCCFMFPFPVSASDNGRYRDEGDESGWAYPSDLSGTDTLISEKTEHPFLFGPIPSSSKASTPSNEVELEFAGSVLWSGMYDAEIRDTLVYCAMISGLMILDISDPADPTFISKLYLPEGNSMDLKVYGDYVYLADWDGAFYIIDVSDPVSPRVAGKYITPEWVYGLDVSGDIACVVYGSVLTDIMGILILDVSNPAAITLKAEIPDEESNPPQKVGMRGDFAYVLNDGYILTIDISDPSSPMIRSQFYTGYMEYYPVDLDVFDDDTLIYIADLDIFQPASRSAFTVVNAADPDNPSIVGRHNFAGAVGDARKSGNLGFAANGMRGVQVLDLSDPSHPDSIGNYPVPTFAGKVAVKDTLAFIVDCGPQVDAETSSSPKAKDPADALPGDVIIVSVSDPAAPSLLSVYSMPAPVTKVTASGDYAYAISRPYLGYDMGAEVNIVDISDEDNPALVGSYNNTSGAGANAQVVDTFLYLAAGLGGLEIINVSDPANPTLVGACAVGSGTVDVAVRGNYAYLASTLGFWVWEVSDPANPRLVDNLSTYYTVHELGLYGDYIYISEVKPDCSSSTIEIFNISDPENPFYVNRFRATPDSYHQQTYISGDYLYSLGAWGAVFYIHYLADNPEDPQYINYFYAFANHADLATDLTAWGDYVLLAGGYEGTVQIVNVSDPTAPYWAGLYNTPGTAEGLFADSDHVYVADWGSLIILKHQIPTDADDPNPVLPEEFALRQNYPNPFNPATTIEFILPRRSEVRLTIYNLLGQEVTTLVDGVESAGYHAVQWDGRDSHGQSVAGGIYFYRINTGGNLFKTKKMLLLK
jgi:hypothetical protein